MRTTISISPQLLHQLKVAASRDGVTLSHLIEEAAREKLLQKKSRARPSHTPLPVFDADPNAKPVKLPSNAELYEMMDLEDLERRNASSQREHPR